jgi:hypothetical protein
MKYQRGVALSGLIFWGVIFFLVAVLGMKVAPTTIEYYKILKNTKAVVAQVPARDCDGGRCKSCLRQIC